MTRRQEQIDWGVETRRLYQPLRSAVTRDTRYEPTCADDGAALALGGNSLTGDVADFNLFASMHQELNGDTAYHKLVWPY